MKKHSPVAQIANDDFNNPGFSSLPVDLKVNQPRAKLFAATVDFFVPVVWHG